LIKVAVRQQAYQDIGTSFPMPSKNPAFMLLLLPYSFIMNLFFPLFILARNLQSFLQSFENAFLVYLAYYFYRSRDLVFQFAKRTVFIKIFFFFFVTGIIFIALINTNLGLATREKAMYVPAFFILIGLVYVYKKQNISGSRND
jgi:hypothetical protein